MVIVNVGLSRYAKCCKDLLALFGSLLLVHGMVMAKTPGAPDKAGLLGKALAAKATCLTQPIACGQTVSGTLDPNDCALSDGTFADFYDFQGSIGEDVTIDLKSSQFDTFLALFKPNSELAAGNDDGGTGTNSRIEYTLDQDGAWSIAANNFAPGDEGDYSLTLACSQPAPPPSGSFSVDPSITGAWFDPSHDGEGWKIEVIDATTAVVYWFTFPPPGMAKAGTGNGQAWMIGVGQIHDNNITIDEVTITHGAKFGDAFDPNDVVSEVWGDMEFTFTGPATGSMTYNGPAQWGSGSFNISRLSSVNGLGSAPDVATVDNLGAGITGSWFNPAHNGEGWIIEVIDAGTALIFWFTYDDQGNQAWNLGIGKLAGNKIFVDAPIEPKGTQFGSGFNHADVVNEPWGIYQFSFDGCGTGRVAYGNAKGLGLGFQPIQRLSAIDSVDCTPFDPNTAPDNAIAINPADPLLMSVKRKSGLLAEVSGAKQADGTATSIQAVKLTDAAGKKVTVLADAKNRPSAITGDNDNRLDITYTDDPNVFFMQATLPNGDQSISRIDLRTLKAKAQGAAAKTRVPMRSGQAHGWVSHEQSAGAATSGAEKSGGASNVFVERCGSPIDNATVTVQVIAGDTTLSLPAPRSGSGVYTAAIPTTATPPASTPPDQMCNKFAGFADENCALVRFMDERDIVRACVFSSPDFGDDPFDNASVRLTTGWLAECVRSLTMMQEACNGHAPAGTQSTLDQFLCENVNESLDRAVDVLADNVTIQPTAQLPGKGAFVLDAQNAPAFGPFPDFQFAFNEDVSITSFTISPPDPAPKQSYVASASIDCAPASTGVTISVSGTDGFGTSTTCGITGSGTCNLSVPGALEAGVRDTITVQVENGPTRTIVIVF